MTVAITSLGVQWHAGVSKSLFFPPVERLTEAQALDSVSVRSSDLRPAARFMITGVSLPIDGGYSGR